MCFGRRRRRPPLRLLPLRPPLMQLRLAVALGLALFCSWAAAAPLDVLRDCAANASGTISGIKDLSAACPHLEGALHTLGLEQILYDGWRLNRDTLRDLAKLAEDYGGARPAGAPDAAALPGILKALEREQTPQPKSWWDEFRAWLRTWLSHHSDALTWLDRWLDRLGRSMTVVNVITYSLIALVLMAAGAVIVNELRASGSLRGRRSRLASAPNDLNSAAASSDSEGLGPLSPADRLKALLRMLVRRLMQTRRLKAERSLTHRELVMQSVFDDESQRVVFARVARSAEAILYGPQGAAPDQLDRVIQEGQTLLAQLPDTSSGH
jgi:hypothetical protein